MTANRTGAADAADATPHAGLVWVYHFEPDGSSTVIPGDAVDAAFAAHTGWTWVHLSLADTRCRVWISQHAPVSELARETLMGADEHMRLDVVGQEIIGVVPDLQQEMSKTGETLVRVRFVMTERLLISARRAPAHSVDHNRRAIESGKRFPTAISFLDAIVDQFADATGHMAERLGAELDVIEDNLVQEEPADHRPRIGRVRSQAVRVHRQLTQLRIMFHRIEPRMERDNHSVAQALRALAQKLDAIDHEFGSVHERARLLLDEMAAKMTEITNRRLFTLSILTACLLPPTLVTGFFGMNTKDMPLQNTDGGTWFALIVAFAAGGLSYWALRRLRAL
jgi:zinc transporter